MIASSPYRFHDISLSRCFFLISHFPGVGFGVSAPQLFEGGVCVNLGRREFRVAEQFLHALYASLVVEHCGGEGVAQHMRRALFHRGHPREVMLDNLPNLLAGHSLTIVADEERLAVARSLGIATLSVEAQGLLQFAAERDEAFLVALSPHLELLSREVHRRIVEASELGETDARGVEH